LLLLFNPAICGRSSAAVCWLAQERITLSAAGCVVLLLVVVSAVMVAAPCLDF
jgi:hypothetical protein